jgi:arylsulfatase/arylsulfatase A
VKRLDRRGWIIAAALAIVVAAGCDEARRSDRSPARPNVVVIVTDDQGFGDLGWTGNPVLRTPNLDRLAREGVVLERFYAEPVCAPTRAGLLTGRYAYRTRVVDTYRGRAILDPQERTLAEWLGEAGYRCGIFGKWHLGDNAPSRPIDQGFQDALVHRGGGIGQDSDPPGGSSYYDPVLFRDGQPVQTQGYCSDVFTDAALRFIEANASRPFYVHLAFNVPHVPLEIREGVERWKAVVSAARGELNLEDDPAAIETTARVYAMVETIDRNVGRLLGRLRDLGLDESTLILFLTDNGPQQRRWNAGLRGLKGSVYEGGIRVPFAARWPGRLPAGRQVAVPSHVIDVVPTVLEACGIELSEPELQLDGRSLWSLWTGQAETVPERYLFAQWHRGDVPVEGRGCAVIGSRWKLVQAAGTAENRPFEARWQLFDLSEDPAETQDRAVENPEEVERMREVYRRWFAGVTSRGFDPVRIWVGSETESPVVLTRQDRRGGRGIDGAEAGATETAAGRLKSGWYLDVVRGGRYRLDVVWDDGSGRVELEAGGVVREVEVTGTRDRATGGLVLLEAGPARLDAVARGAGGNQTAARYVRLERLEESAP